MTFAEYSSVHVSPIRPVLRQTHKRSSGKRLSHAHGSADFAKFVSHPDELLLQRRIMIQFAVQLE